MSELSEKEKRLAVELIEKINTNLEIEKEWKTESGYLAMVIVRKSNDFPLKTSHLNGYVFIPSNHPIYAGFGIWGKEKDLKVHGSVTFKDFIVGVDPTKGKAIGFDCAHFAGGDKPIDPGIPISYKDLIRHKTETEKRGVIFEGEPFVKGLDFCVKECESLAKQLKDMENNDE